MTSPGDIFFGANTRNDAYYMYGGMNYAFNGDKSATGCFLSLLAGDGGYEYDTLLGGVDAELIEIDLGLGYKWALASHTLSLTGALNYSDHHLNGNPIDLAANSVSGKEYGFKARVDVWNNDTTNFLYGGIFSYSTAFDAYWNRVVFAPKLGSVYLGPELILQGNEEYQEHRAGLALSGLKLGLADIGTSVGYAWADPDVGVNDQEGLYGTVHVSFEF